MNAIGFDSWHGYYKPWPKNILLAESYRHPAKVSFALAERIYRHCLDEVWLKPGNRVIDPFAGIGGFAFHAMQFGMDFVGMELEPDFIELAQESYTCPGFDRDFWRRYQGRQEFIGLLREMRALCPSCETALAPKAKMNKRTGRVIERRIPHQAAHVYRGNIPRWENRFNGSFAQRGTARIVQGDSRSLLAVLAESGAAACVASPPYVSGGHHPDQTGAWGGQAQSVPRNLAGYGQAEGQMGQMPEGRLDAAISSPPYAGPPGHDSGHPRLDAIEDERRVREGSSRRNGYGASTGQLAALPDGALDAAVSSPPYEASINAGNDADEARQRKAERYARGEFKTQRPDVFVSPDNIGARGMFNGTYGKSESQVGAMQGDTFWSASRLILEQTRAALRPSAHACWVLKPFVRNHAVVDFPGYWRQVCESVGFRLLHVHVCWQVEQKGLKQLGLDGTDKAMEKWCASFFRRLHSKKYPHLKIDFEIVQCYGRD